MVVISYMFMLVILSQTVFCVTIPDIRQGANYNRSQDTEAPQGQRCWGRHQFGSKYSQQEKICFNTLCLETRDQRCCTPDAPCEEGEGDCNADSECMFGLKCGDNNCKQYGQYYHKKDDCCEPGMYGC